MKTRFDECDSWITKDGEMPLSEMSTQHLMNAYMVFIKYPERTMSMLVADIETGVYFEDAVWTGRKRQKDSIKQSVHNVTAMSATELVDYAIHSPLGQAIYAELIARGVDVENVQYLMTSQKNGGAA